MCCMISALLVAEEKRKQKEQLKILKQQVELQLFGFFFLVFFFSFFFFLTPMHTSCTTTPLRRKLHISMCPALATYRIIVAAVISGTSFLFWVCFGGFTHKKQMRFYLLCMCVCIYILGFISNLGIYINLYQNLNYQDFLKTVFRLY